LGRIVSHDLDEVFLRLIDRAEPMPPHFVLTVMDRKPLKLWCAYPGDLQVEGVAEACAALLNDEERARVARFKFEQHRRESLATRALVRTALSRSRPVAAREWRFTSNAQGKPAVDPECRLSFNLSNSPGLVVCLVAEGVAEVGVDVESQERAKQIMELVPKVFSAREREQLAALPDAEKLDRALSLWTLKESYIKARGLGLSIPLDEFSFVFGGAEGIRLEINAGLGDDGGRWRFCQLDYAGHRIAGMVDRSAAGELEVWEARPVLAAPVCADVGEVRWFPRGVR
jgi:4'-phosphopantetheinyl transferase